MSCEDIMHVCHEIHDAHVILGTLLVPNVVQLSCSRNAVVMQSFQSLSCSPAPEAATSTGPALNDDSICPTSAAFHTIRSESTMKVVAKRMHNDAAQYLQDAIHMLI